MAHWEWGGKDLEPSEKSKRCLNRGQKKMVENQQKGEDRNCTLFMGQKNAMRGNEFGIRAYKSKKCGERIEGGLKTWLQIGRM